MAVFAQVRPLSDPAFHSPAVSAVSKEAFSSSRVKRHQHGANADADDNQAERFYTVAPCQRPDDQRGQDPAEHGRQRNGGKMLAK